MSTKRLAFTMIELLVVFTLISFFMGFWFFLHESPTSMVAGRIFFKGKPLVGKGTITFVKEKNGKAANGKINEDGTYLVKGIPFGETKVLIFSPNVPVKYAGPNSPLRFTVTQAREIFDIVISGE